MAFKSFNIKSLESIPIPISTKNVFLSRNKRLLSWLIKYFLAAIIPFHLEKFPKKPISTIQAALICYERNYYPEML